MCLDNFTELKFKEHVASGTPTNPKFLSDIDLFQLVVKNSKATDRA